jgi:hypothetical protein
MPGAGTIGTCIFILERIYIMTQAKTVDVSIIITRDGLTQTQNFPKLSYATFVALQSACASVLSTLQSWGSARVAALAGGKQDRVIGGTCDLRCELQADHGGGTSEVVIGYTGISAQIADEISGALLKAVASVTK